MKIDMRSVAGAAPHGAQTADFEAQLVASFRDEPKRFPVDASGGRSPMRVLTVGAKWRQLAPRRPKDPDDRLVVGELGFSPAGRERRRLRAPSFVHTSRLRTLMLDQCIDEVHVFDPTSVSKDALDATLRAAGELGIPVCLYARNGDSPPSDCDDADCPGDVEWRHLHAMDAPALRAGKRGIDIVLSAALIVLLSPLLLAVALAILLNHGGPVFFRQPRVGYRRRQFMMIKFRTMVVNAEELRNGVAALNSAKGISFKIVADPRVTAVGKLLRSTSLDELPQLINVLLGDMSLVGPCPIPVWVAEQLRDTRFYRRFSVPAGVSGWWQIRGRTQDFDVMATEDLEYVDRWSMLLDLRIIAATIPAVLRGEGASERPVANRERA